MNVNFEICTPNNKVITPRCTYCDYVLDGKYIKIKFDTIKALHVHKGECWDNFVVGISMINDELTRLEQN
jgi:hypothetical protein